MNGNIFFTLWHGPARYIILIFAVYIIIGLPFTIFYYKRRKNAAAAYLEQHPSASTVLLVTRVFFGNLSDTIFVTSANNEIPVHFYEAKKQAFYILPGENIIEVEASWTKKGLTKTTTTTTGPVKIKVTAEPYTTYQLKYDIDENRFIFEKNIEK